VEEKTCRCVLWGNFFPILSVAPSAKLWPRGPLAAPGGDTVNLDLSRGQLLAMGRGGQS
jgi:hypothetical protein